MIEERSTLPESFGGLFDTALTFYGKRIGFYVAIAFAGFLIQGASALITSTTHTAALESALIELILNTIVDAFILGAVAIGVVADSTQTTADNGQIFRSAMARWPALIAVTALINAVMFESNPVSPDISLGIFLLFVLPVSVLWATVAFASVICAVDTSQSPIMRMIGSFGQSFRLALAPGNIGRNAILGIMLLVPVLLGVVLDGQLTRLHVGEHGFWSEIPIDALVVGPFQAVFAVFYLDFIRRYTAAQATR